MSELGKSQFKNGEPRTQNYFCRYWIIGSVYKKTNKWSYQGKSLPKKIYLVVWLGIFVCCQWPGKKVPGVDHITT